MTPLLVLRIEIPRPLRTGRKSRALRINATTRFADPFDVANHFFATGSVFQINLQLANGIAVFGFPVPDEALAFEHFGHTSFDLGNWHFHIGPFHAYRVADASKHVGNWVSHHSRLFPLTCLYQLALRTPGNHTLVRKVAKADSTHAKFAINRTRTATQFTSSFTANRIFRFETLWRFSIFLPQQKPVKKSVKFPFEPRSF